MIDPPNNAGLFWLVVSIIQTILLLPLTALIALVCGLRGFCF